MNKNVTKYCMQWLVALFILISHHAQCENLTAIFDGEKFFERYSELQDPQNKLIEFTPEGQTINNWSYLLAYRTHQIDALENDPSRIALAMGYTIKKANPEANYQVLKKNKEAIIDFLTWEELYKSKFIEFNVWRYIKSKDGKFVISLQFAHRFKPDSSSEGIKKFKKFREHAIDEIMDFDMQKVRDQFE